MVLESQRLILKALNSKQLYMLLNDKNGFEKALNYTYDGENLDSEMGQIFSDQIPLVKEVGNQFIWNTFWMITVEKCNVVIGSIGFKSLPDENGEIEINYGLNPRYWNVGYATEAVSTLSQWALSFDAINRIVAEVESWNIASQKVLNKCGYHYFKTIEKCYWYELK